MSLLPKGNATSAKGYDGCMRLTFPTPKMSQPRDYSIQIPQNPVEEKLIDARENYRQLKVVSLSNNDKIDAKLFQIHELDTYYKLASIKYLGTTTFNEKITKLPRNMLYIFGLGKFLTPNSKGRSGNSTAPSFNYEDWIVLHTNKVFSNFGESWTRPLKWLIFFHIIFFTALIFTNDSIPITITSWRQHDWLTLWKGCGLFLNLINPVHAFKLPNQFNEGRDIELFGVLDFLMRIFSAYFLYYFIKATRKYNLS